MADTTQPSSTSGLASLDDISLERLELELPFVDDGQVPLSELLSRVVQTIYTELSEMAETLPNMSDSARKRTLADWVVRTKKQVVKLLVVTKWSRDAGTVQKCMNITAFLMDQGRQFEDAISALNNARQGLDSARLRNHDLLTSLDVLSTGSYRRLPTIIKKSTIPPTPLTDNAVLRTLSDLENSIRVKLRLHEIIPVEMSKYRIANGRVYFTVPDLYEVCLSLRGGEKDDGWFFVNVEFFINISGDLENFQEFPRSPTGPLRQYIADEADSQLARYIPLSESDLPDAPSRPSLPEHTVDAPLIRVYNFLQMMALSYQLEILWYQAERLRSLGWADYLNIEMSPDRKKLKIFYWTRPPIPVTGRPRMPKIPSYAGTLIIEIVDSSRSRWFPHKLSHSPPARVLSNLQVKSKLGSRTPSDHVEGMLFRVVWIPERDAFGVSASPEDLSNPPGLSIRSDCLDFEKLLSLILLKHSRAVLKSFQLSLYRGRSSVFNTPGTVVFIDNELPSLKVALCADAVVYVSVDQRTGRLSLRDSGNLAATSGGSKFSILSKGLNDNPPLLFELLITLRMTTIVELIEQKARYLGLQSFRHRNFRKDELLKFGQTAKGQLFIQLANFPRNYLVIVITDDGFQYALITTIILPQSMFNSLAIQELVWLDLTSLRGSVSPTGPPITTTTYTNLGAETLRDLYNYCCARMAYLNVESQLKLRGIDFSHIKPSNNLVAYEASHIQSGLAQSVPSLRVLSEHLLSGSPAAEAAMPNIRIIPLNWWSDKPVQVATCVKLKYVQQPLGKTAGTSAVIRPSKRIIYDTKEAVVTFLSENVNTCVDEFLEEWARVSKMVVIAREVAQMSKDKDLPDVRLLSFDLQTVEFEYATTYSVSITCQDQLSSGGNFDLQFSRCQDKEDVRFNPHDNAEPFFRNILRNPHGRLAQSVHQLVKTLRSTLPIVSVLEEIKSQQRPEDVESLAVDTIAKGAGWYRLMYGDFRHAIDCRMMSGNRMAILDASYNLFKREGSAQTLNEVAVFQPIPNFQAMASNVILASTASGTHLQQRMKQQMVGTDIGIICDIDSIGPLVKAIHSEVLTALSPKAGV